MTMLKWLNIGSVRGNDVEQLSIAVGSAGSKPIVIERKVLVEAHRRNVLI